MAMPERLATIDRRTTETQIRLTLHLDGTGKADIKTGVPFLDHMLTLTARHGLFDLEVAATGDLDVDLHHTVEDTGICLGQAIVQALGDKAGIVRYGTFTVPMDEVLVTASLDLSGRPFFAEDLELAGRWVGTFDCELVHEFFQAIAANGLMNLHFLQHRGGNAHHVAEAAFKAFGRALDAATRVDARVQGVPSTKGVL
jgi:imidazoleglycerol-phosphate dehydratase